MPRPKSKQELLTVANGNYDKLLDFIENMTSQERNTPFDFSKDIKKKEAHWKRDKNLRDILIHLYEWHQLLLHWIDRNVKGQAAHFLPKPYTWKTYGELNLEFWQKHQTTSQEDAMNLFKESHKTVMDVIKTYSNEELFTKRQFDWTGTTSLGSYCISATSSHYNWALKKLRALRRNLNNNG